MKESNTHLIIGYINPVNLEKHSLLDGIKKIKEIKIDDVIEIDNNIDNFLFCEREDNMVKGLKCYVGSSILGYRIALPILEKSFYANDIRVIGSKKIGYNNNLKKLKLVKKTCIK